MEMSYDEIVEKAKAETRTLVTVERYADHAVLRLDDPDKLNVLSPALMLQLRRAADELVADPEVRAVVLTGAGRAFCSGGDLRMMSEQPDRARRPDDREGVTLPWQWIRYQFGQMVRLIARSDTAFVAALNGHAAGVGLAFALSCDIVVADADAVLVPAFGDLGLIPEVGTSWALTRALGYRQAFAFYVSGRHVGATEALRLGLVNDVVGADELLDTALAWCRRIAELPAHAVPLTKPLLRAASDLPWEHALTMEEYAEPMCFSTEGFRRGVADVVARTSSGTPS